MRIAALLLAAAILTGCEDKRSATPASTAAPPSTAVAKRANPEADAKAQEEPETDKEPARFDPANPKRTLRWIASVREQAIQPVTNRSKAVEQLKASQNAFASCLKQTVKWKIPLEKVTADHMLSLLPIRTTRFVDRSEKHPEMTLRVRPWNSSRDDSLFACEAYPWVSSLRPEQDSVIVQGMITSITTRDNYDWYVSLTDLQFAPESDATASPQAVSATPERFDPEDADKAFAWLRRQVFHAMEPFGDVSDRETRRKRLVAEFRSLAGTPVRWRWPTSVPNDSSILVQDQVVPDYQYQAHVAMGLLLKQPKPSAKAGDLLPVSRLEYDKALLGAPGSKTINPELTAKIRESKKSTVSGKVAKITFGDDRNLPPRAIEIAVSLDDVRIEP